MYNYLKSLDIYGVPVSFNYKGSETFQTMPGAVLSIVFRVMAITYLVFKGANLAFDKDWWVMT